MFVETKGKKVKSKKKRILSKRRSERWREKEGERIDRDVKRERG